MTPKRMLLLLGLAAACFAQTRATVRSLPASQPMVRGPRMGPVGRGFGNVVFPGGGTPNPFYNNATTFAQRFGAVMTGYPGYTPGSQHRRGINAGAVIPYAVPVFVGGYGYGYGYNEPPPNVTIVNTPPAPPQPAVIINQNYTPDRVNPVMRDYTSENLPESPGVRSYQAPVPNNPEGTGSGRLRAAVDPEKPTIYLIAFKDGTVYSCYAYWVEGGTMHYITTKYAHNRASVELVDAEVSRQLNDERSVEFELPSKR